MAFDRRAIIVAKPAVAAAMNQAAADIDALGGAQTFTVPLRVAGDATKTVVAYWCSWALTPAQISALRTALQNRGATVSEAAVILVGQTPTPGNRVYVFDGREDVGWTPGAVLTALNLAPLPQSSP